MIKEFNCYGFRNVSAENLKFKRINILIGPNNAGKSNFIRALSFAANMVSNPINETTGFLTELKRNGWNTIANRYIDSHSFKLVWNFKLEERRPVVYTLCATVGKRRDENYIVEESLDSAQRRSGAMEPYNYFRCHASELGYGQFSTAGLSSQPNKLLFTEVNQFETVLLQMDSLFFENKEMFSTPFVRDEIRRVLESMRRYFRSFYSYSCTAFNIAAIREMQDEQNDGSFLKKDGSNFVNVFWEAMNTEPEFKDRYLHKLRRLVSNCDDVNIATAGGKIWMELTINGCNFPLSEVSDGTIHLLLLLMMLNISEHSGISLLAIDEPEMNLHPAWQKLLTSEILRCQSFKQCFISTHSPDMLDEFTQSFLDGDVGVFVFDSSSKRPIRQLEAQEMLPDLENWSLGDLYRIGDPIIGGWPQ